MGNVVSFIDILRRKCLAHAAVKGIFDRPPAMPEDATSSDWADAIMGRLWNEGFKIVPRDQSDEAS